MPEHAAPRRFTQTDVGNAVEELAAELQRFHAGMMGDEYQKGAIAEIRERLDDLSARQDQAHSEWLAFQSGVPAAINAAVDAARGRRIVQRVDRVHAWVWSSLGIAFASLIAAILIVALHLH